LSAPAGAAARLALAGICKNAQNPNPCYGGRDEKPQLARRLCAPLVRHLFARLRAGELSAAALAAELGLGLTRVYDLRTSYLLACAQGHEGTWQPGLSGGDHRSPWPPEADQLARRLLCSKPRSSYSAVASELLRRLGLKTDRASVRRWAIARNLAPNTRYKTPAKPVRRWQARDYGALWQYDATPHAFLPGIPDKQVLLNILDDATRLNTGARLYPCESLLAHLDFLSRAFLAHGLPMALYVDYHSFFFTHSPNAFTQLGQALHFYGVSLRYAPTPQAKGKIERRHDYWQKRLPPIFAADSIDSIDTANILLQALLSHANHNEIHRELGSTAHVAHQLALTNNHSSIRPAPDCPWWRFIWSSRSTTKVGDDGKVPVRHLRLSIDAPPRSKVLRCILPSGDIFFLKHPPAQNSLPTVLLHSPAF